ncbi:MAG: exodeoxyribonuclease III, partial [Symbiobacteriaceae bacterium]|nr:exodeoxyribonuclease III [Symbiobacteriaceae bacterium]
MRLYSWNVNGLRACLKKGFADFFTTSAADFFCLQETKARAEQVEFAPPGYTAWWHSAVKPGYAGTAVYARLEPLEVFHDFGTAEHQGEGRVLTLEYPGFFLVNTYTPNAQRDLARLEYRMRWQDAYLAWLTALDARKPVIVCGDLNVAHQEIDIKNPRSNRGNAGFTDEERSKMSELLEAGFCDTFRSLYPDTRDAYTWWSYMPGIRERNTGWRIDYFLVSRRLLSAVSEAS